MDVDKRIVQAILLMHVDKSSLAKCDIHSGVIDFIRGWYISYKLHINYKFKVKWKMRFILFVAFISKRVNNDPKRLNMVESYTNELCREQACKLASNGA